MKLVIMTVAPWRGTPETHKRRGGLGELQCLAGKW